MPVGGDLVVPLSILHVHVSPDSVSRFREHTTTFSLCNTSLGLSEVNYSTEMKPASPAATSFSSIAHSLAHVNATTMVICHVGDSRSLAFLLLFIINIRSCYHAVLSLHLSYMLLVYQNIIKLTHVYVYMYTDVVLL